MPTIASQAANSSSTLKGLEGQGTAVQSILNLVITPGPNSVSFTFETQLASSTLIEIFKYITGDPSEDLQPQNLVSNNVIELQGKARKRKYASRLPEPLSFMPSSFPGFSDAVVRPLDQDAHYWFRLTADSAISTVAPAVTFGRFWTSQRNVVAVIEELIVYSYGDSDIGQTVDQGINDLAGLVGLNPPNQSDYHLDLQLGLYDPLQNLVDQVENVFESENNNDDLRNPFPNRSLICKNASDYLWVYGFGQGNEGAWALPPFSGQYFAPNTPPLAVQNGKNNYGPYGEILGVTNRLPDDDVDLQTMTAGGQYPVQLVASTGPGETSFDIIIWFYSSFIAARHAPVIEQPAVQKLTGNLAKSAFSSVSAGQRKISRQKVTTKK